MENLKTYITRMIEHVRFKTNAEEAKISRNRILGINYPKDELHFLDGMHSALTSILNHIKEMENDL